MMQAKIIDKLLSNQYTAKKLEKMVSEREEMNEASLDAAMYKGDIRKFLENLPEDEFLKMLETLYKETAEGGYSSGNQNEGHQNQDATDRGRCGPKQLKDVSSLKPEKQVKPLGNQDQPATDVQNVIHQGNQFFDKDPPAATDVENVGHRSEENQVSDDTNHHGHSICRYDLSVRHQEDASRDHQHQLPLGSVHNEENNDNGNHPHQLDDFFIISSNVEDTDSEVDEESSDSTGSSTNWKKKRCPTPSAPFQTDSDSSKSSPCPTEHVHASQPRSRGSRFDSQTIHNTRRRPHVQESQGQFSGEASHQRLNWELLCIMQLMVMNATLNNIQVAVNQGNRETQNSQVNVCSNCNTLKEQKEELRQHNGLLQAQIAELEDTVRAKNQENEQNQCLIDFLTGKNKNWQVECERANKRSFEYFEEIEKIYMALKEENEMLKERLKESGKEKWKETERNSSAQGNVHQHRAQLMALQHRVGLRFSAGQAKDDDNRPQQAQDDVEPDVD